MEAKDLMIGDWVWYNPNVFNEDEYELPKECYPMKIESGEDIDLAIEGCYEPIPLTAEILRMNGFVEEEVSPYYDGEEPFKLWVLKDECISITINLDGSSFDVFNGNIVSSLSFYNEETFYLHQLQQAMRLCCITKEIKI